MAYGDIGIPKGAIFLDRRALYDAGLHRQVQAGIVGRATEGAESIVLSGGYADDEDHGDEIIYTGHGGRDPLSGRQVADQDFVRQNKALVVNCQEGIPVRVIRGSGHHSQYSPQIGYQYAGLYYVDTYWRKPGQDGHHVCRFRLVAHPELRGDAPKASENLARGPIQRVSSTIQRVVRDTTIGRRIKVLYDYRCQVCDIRLHGSAAPYAEAAHIQPLGHPHDGPDHLRNVICLCPNHHILFDYGAFTIADNGDLIGLPGRLRIHHRHDLDPTCLSYRRTMWGSTSQEATE